MKIRLGRPFCGGLLLAGGARVVGQAVVAVHPRWRTQRRALHQWPITRNGRTGSTELSDSTTAAGAAM